VSGEKESGMKKQEFEMDVEEKKRIVFGNTCSVEGIN
jgi:hypothetical protein